LQRRGSVRNDLAEVRRYGAEISRTVGHEDNADRLGLWRRDRTANVGALPSRQAAGYQWQHADKKAVAHHSHMTSGTGQAVPTAAYCTARKKHGVKVCGKWKRNVVGQADLVKDVGSLP
jgi:5-methylcytosine-specific restriction endonuclease McrA